MSEEFSAPTPPDEEPERTRWQKRPPMPAVKPRPKRREQALTMAQLVAAAARDLENCRRKDLAK